MTGWDTPWGKNVRYTVQFERLAERIGDHGGLRPLPGSIAFRVITPNGEPTAVALAARWFDEKHPHVSYSKVVVVGCESEFEWEQGDLGDADSRAL